MSSLGSDLLSEELPFPGDSKGSEIAPLSGYQIALIICVPSTYSVSVPLLLCCVFIKL